MPAPVLSEPAPAEPGSLKMVAVMGAVGLIASVLLVATYQTTAPYIAANRAAYLEQAILEVLPGAATRVTFTRDGDRLAPAEGDGVGAFRVFAGYDEGGALVGVAVEASGQGFQDVLGLIYGYVPDCECVVGMKVLETKETPGLGDKIETDPAFRSNFDALDVRLAPDGEAVLHPVELVKSNAKEEAWQIAAITGATISSRAVATIIAESTAGVVPLIHRNLDVLRGEAAGVLQQGP